MVKPTSVDDIVAKFPMKILPPIPGEPDYDCISKLNQLIYGNIATLPTTLGGGAHGNVVLIMKATIYLTLSPTAYVAPAEPPLTPVIPTTKNKCGMSTTPLSANKQNTNLHKPHQYV